MEWLKNNYINTKSRNTYQLYRNGAVDSAGCSWGDICGENIRFMYTVVADNDLMDLMLASGNRVLGL
jgi:hypothetical protein